ncbi:MAG TPA: S24 family peptidase [Terriglobales bacterium]|nr:S24 family peptidase [Terriglobales bacterium]
MRKILWTRIDEGKLTGLRLAEQTGFQQAHISNFLNRKRGLSTEGMDKVLSVQRLSVLDLLDPAEINERASILPPNDDMFENIAVVANPVAAAQSSIMRMKVKEIVKLKKRFLKKLRPQPEGDRKAWVRFVAIQVTDGESLSMYPRLAAGATILIDRHYNSLKPYRKAGPNIYAVNKSGHCIVRYVELAGRQLVLRPHNQAFPVEIMHLGEGKRASDYLVGRVCHIALEP